MIPNLHTVSKQPLVLRGGQPETFEDWLSLKKQGIIQVIKLNEDKEGSDQIVSDLNMVLFKNPISIVQQIITEPDWQFLMDAVGFIDDGTFVHCSHGQDRTGVVIAIWRVKKCGWTKDQAYKEMISMGYHNTELGLDKIWKDAT